VVEVELEPFLCDVSGRGFERLTAHPRARRTKKSQMKRKAVFEMVKVRKDITSS